MSDDEIVCGPAAPAPAPAAPAAPAARRQRQQRGIETRGHFVGYLVGDPRMTETLKICEGFVPAAKPPKPLVVGMALCTWHVQEHTAELEQEWRGISARPGRGSAPWGFLRYSWGKVWELDVGFDSPGFVEELDADSTTTALMLHNAISQSIVHEQEGATVESVLKPYAELPMRVLRIPWDSLDVALQGDLPNTFSLIPLGARVDPRSLVLGQPELKTLRGLRSRWRGGRQDSPREELQRGSFGCKRTREDIVLALPNKRSKLSLDGEGRQVGGALGD